MFSALSSLVARARTRFRRSNAATSQVSPTLKVLVSGRPPAHRVRYVDQILGDTSISGPPSDIEFEFRDSPTGHEAVDVLHLTDSTAVLGDQRVPQSEKVRRATRFARTLRRRRVALVRTIDTESFRLSTKSAAEAVLDRATTHHVVLSPISPAPHGGTVTLVPHSHLKSRFLGYPRNEARQNRLLIITPGSFSREHEASLKVFAYADSPTYTMQLVGRVPSSLSSSFSRTISRNRTRIALRDEVISDAERVVEISRAELVLIALSDGAEAVSTMLLALSLDRPVLVEDTPTTRKLAEEVGDSWVRLHTGLLTVATLEQALVEFTDSPPNGRPNLDGRDPSVIAEKYAAIYRAAAMSR